MGDYDGLDADELRALLEERDASGPPAFGNTTPHGGPLQPEPVPRSDDLEYQTKVMHRLYKRDHNARTRDPKLAPDFDVVQWQRARFREAFKQAQKNPSYRNME